MRFSESHVARAGAFSRLASFRYLLDWTPVLSRWPDAWYIRRLYRIVTFGGFERYNRRSARPSAVITAKHWITLPTKPLLPSTATMASLFCTSTRFKQLLKASDQGYDQAFNS
jgi:hypothetical protein